MMNTSRIRNAQNELPSKSPHQNHQQEEPKGEEISKDHKTISVPYLPTPIVFEILSRVRIKTLFNCRLVCKSWADLISTPEFAKLHLSRSPTSCLIKPLSSNRKSKRLHLIEPESPYSLSSKMVFMPKINLPNVPLGLINSCNGLLCLGQLRFRDSYSAFNIIVCNPVLREFITIPKPSNALNFDTRSCAFGFSHITNQYKVVFSSYHDSDNYGAKIYTLGEGSWRSIGNTPYETRNRNFYAFLNGALHWTSYGRQCPLICCFDFESEQFRAVPEPSEFRLLMSDVCDQMHVGVIYGNLSICDFTYAVVDGVVIWVMKDYGVKESWSKSYVLPNTIFHIEWDIEPIMIKGNGEILMKFDNKSIKLYDPKSEAFESEVKIFGVSSKFRAIAHVPSLISLKDVAKGENLMVLGRN